MQRASDPASFAVIEPRLRHLAREIARLLSIVELEKDGRPVEVDGFRLRDLSQWTVHRASNVLDALLPISARCNSHCAFCFEHGVPFARDATFMTEEEALTRLRHYSPETGACLFPSNRPEMETFLHPRALDILEAARRREPGTLFCITTNGSRLDEATIERLAGLRPLLLKLSLNVSDEALHRQLVNVGASTGTALGAPPLLRRHGIPYIGGIVAWPTLPLEAIEETARYFEEHEAYAIRIRLPLVHQWSREQPDVAWNRHWQRIAEFARTLHFRVPLVVEPTVFTIAPVLPFVDGVILHSPAERAGVRSGDLVESIDGEAILTRPQSEAALARCHHAGRAVELRVKRDGEALLFQLERQANASYPYDPCLPYSGQNYGIFHVHDLRLEQIANVFTIARCYRARKVLLFSSPLVKPIFEFLSEKVPEFAAAREEIDIAVETVPNSPLGGNFSLLDGRFVEDFARAISQRLESGEKIDLVLIPAAFGGAWGIDLTGDSFTRLSIEFGIPVELVDWHIVYGREI